MCLSNLTAARKTFGRVIRAYGRGEVKENVYRALVYGLSHYLGYLKTERELDIDAQLAEIRERLGMAL